MLSSKSFSLLRSSYSLKVGIRVAQPRCTFATGSAPTNLKRTSLYPLHIELKGKMVDFAGWEMPVQYPEGILNSHLHTRQHSSLFDVSHMAQLRLTGKDRVKFLETLVVGDIEGLPENNARLSVFTNEKGGIIDDTVITNRGDHIYIVVNAGCAEKDIAHIKSHLAKFVAKGGDVKLEVLDRSLVALQGPESEKVLSRLVKADLTKMPFMTCKELEVDGIKNVLESRCGYTGEDGFEISVDHGNAVKLSKKLLSFPEVKPAGLGPRDSLRLEAGLCLYGHDLEQDITPVEGSLTWVIGKRRKEQGGFLGADVILAQLKNGVSKKRVGFLVNGSPARDGAIINDVATGKEIGKVTSGTFSPILKQAIAMGYIETPFSKLDTKVNISVRGKPVPAVVAKMPFVPTNYKKV